MVEDTTETEVNKHKVFNLLVIQNINKLTDMILDVKTRVEKLEKKTK